VQRHHLDAVRLAQLLQHVVEIGILSVEASDHDDPRRLRLLELIPNGLRADLHPCGRVDQDDRGIGHAQSGMTVAGKVGEPRGVEEVDLGAVVGERGEGHVDGDAALVLLGIGVEDARAVVHLAQTCRGADEMEQRLDERGLAGAAVTGDRDVADALGCG